MIIKCQALSQQLNRKQSAVYILSGQDHYLLNDAALTIKKAWGQQGERDDKTLDINSANDWSLLLEEANSYSLFADLVLLDVRYDKKSLDSVGKKTIQAYLDNINPRCLVMIRAPQIPNKQLQWLAHHEHVTLVQAYPLTPAALEHWITTQLKAKGIQYEANVPSLIHQYTQHNMLACAQLIDKLALIQSDQLLLTTQTVTEHLIDQCDYSLYELADACLAGLADKAIHLLRLAQQNRSEQTLLLWILTQEIRQLIQLVHLIDTSVSFSNACSQLKIWSQRTKLYEKSLTRLSATRLYQLLQISQKLDEQIKSSQSAQAWHGLEQIALGICGKAQHI